MRVALLSEIQVKAMVMTLLQAVNFVFLMVGFDSPRI